MRDGLVVQSSRQNCADSLWSRPIYKPVFDNEKKIELVNIVQELFFLKGFVFVLAAADNN